MWLLATVWLNIIGSLWVLKIQAHLQLSLPFRQEFRLRSRVALAQKTRFEKLLGYLWYHELRYQKDNWFTLDARYTQFQSPNHQTRLYVYEPSIRYSSSMESWQGRGHSFLVLASVTPHINDAKKLRLQLQLRYHYAQFMGEKSIGSGLNERLGNQQHTLKGQVIMYWKWIPLIIFVTKIWLNSSILVH